VDSTPSSPIAPQDDAATFPQHPQHNDMKIKYHPNSGRGTRALSSADYRRHHFERNQSMQEDCPWRPFHTRLDFEAAELALKTSMNKEQTETLFHLLGRTASNREIFTLDTYNDAVKMWDLASSIRTGVSSE
jgi:hypothetical protein